MNSFRASCDGGGGRGGRRGRRRKRRRGRAALCPPIHARGGRGNAVAIMRRSSANGPWRKTNVSTGAGRRVREDVAPLGRRVSSHDCLPPVGPGCQCSKRTRRTGPAAASAGAHNRVVLRFSQGARAQAALERDGVRRTGRAGGGIHGSERRRRRRRGVRRVAQRIGSRSGTATRALRERTAAVMEQTYLSVVDGFAVTGCWSSLCQHVSRARSRSAATTVVENANPDRAQGNSIYLTAKD